MRRNPLFPMVACFALLFALLLAVTAHAQTVGGIQQKPIACTTSSGQVLAPGTAVFFIFVAVPSTASTGVWFDWVGAGAVQSPPSEYIAPGGSKVWGTSPGMLPTGQVNCIASSTVNITLEYR